LHSPDGTVPEKTSSIERLDYLAADEDDELELLDVIKPIPNPPIAPARIPISASMMTLSNKELLLRPILGPPSFLR
jgi:hypothetical protein